MFLLRNSEKCEQFIDSELNAVLLFGVSTMISQIYKISSNCILSIQLSDSLI